MITKDHHFRSINTGGSYLACSNPQNDTRMTRSLIADQAVRWQIYSKWKEATVTDSSDYSIVYLGITRLLWMYVPLVFFR